MDAAFVEKKERIKSSITDAEFFASQTLYRKFLFYISSVTHSVNEKRAGKYALRLIQSASEDSAPAWTDGTTITINYDCDYVKYVGGNPEKGERTRENKLQLYEALLAHELSHVLYTSPRIQVLYFKMLLEGKWFPYHPSSPAQAEIIQFLSENRCRAEKQTFVGLIKELYNRLEDGYVDERFAKNFPGTLARRVRQLRPERVDAGYIDHAIEKIKSAAGIMDDASIASMELSLFYRVYFAYVIRKIFPIEDVDATIKEPLFIDIAKGLIFVDKYMSEQNLADRIYNMNELLCHMWPYFKRLFRADCDDDENGSWEDDGESAEGGERTPDNNGTGDLGGNEGDKLLDDLMEQRRNSGGDYKGDANVDELALTPDSNSSPENTDIDNREAISSAIFQIVKRDKEELLEEDEPEESGCLPFPLHHPHSEEDAPETDASKMVEVVETENPDKRKIAALGYDPAVFELPTEDLDCKVSEDGVKNVNRLLEEMAQERMFEREAQLQQDQMTKDAVRELQNNNLHARCPIYVRRPQEIPPSVEYDLQHSPYIAKLRETSRLLQRLVRQQLKDEEAGRKSYGFYSGKSIEMSRVISDKQGRFFYRRTLPFERPQIAVMLLIDQSGSMRDNDRLTTAQAIAWVIFDFCRSLNIPVSIFGHNEERYTKGSEKRATVCVTSYVPFDSMDRADEYRIFTIDPSGCNRDGAALQYVYSIFAKRKEEHKLLFVLSDGQPNSLAYSGNVAKEDIQHQVAKAQRKGVSTIAASISSDYEAIRKIYGRCIDVSDLAEAPRKLTALIVKAIAERKKL